MSNINLTGINELREFLLLNHKLAHTFSDAELNAWAQDAEFQLDQGNPPTIEVPARHSLSGVAVEYTVSDCGVDLT